MKNLYMCFPENKSKALTLSYDDGSRYDIKLAEIITKYRLKCTFNICSGLVADSSDGWHLTKEEIEKYIVSAKHEIAVHTAYHRAPGIIDLTDGIKEVLECREALEGWFGGIIKGMAYPNSGVLFFDNGFSYQSVKNYLTELGISYARSLGGDNDNFRLPEDWHNWIPTAHHGNPELMRYIEKFISNTSQEPKLFYLWGHSYEFHANDNWDLLIEICEKLSGREDIWYATNIEIYNYVTAFRSLIFNVKKTVVYNPSAQDIWFKADDKNYLVKSGEAINI